MGTMEIEKIINKHHGDQRVEVVNTYRREVEQALENTKSIRSQHIQLISSVSKFLPPPEKHGLVEKAINAKAFQVRTYILSNFKSDFSQDKSHFSAFSEWMKALVTEIHNTFYQTSTGKPIDKAMEEAFHRKILEELKLIFCSNEKFNSGGNQLLLDLKMYSRSFEAATKEKAALEERIRKNFNEGKAFPPEKINELYEQISSSSAGDSTVTPKDTSPGKDKDRTNDSDRVKIDTSDRVKIDTKEKVKEKVKTDSSDKTRDKDRVKGNDKEKVKADSKDKVKGNDKEKEKANRAK